MNTNIAGSIHRDSVYVCVESWGEGKIPQTLENPRRKILYAPKGLQYPCYNSKVKATLTITSIPSHSRDTANYAVFAKTAFRVMLKKGK